MTRIKEADIMPAAQCSMNTVKVVKCDMDIIKTKAPPNCDER